MATDGVVVMFGNSSGDPTPLGFRDFGGRARTKLYSFHVYDSGEPPTLGADLGLMTSLIASGALTPDIGFQGTWRDATSAIAALRNRQFVGKAVLDVD